MNVITTDSLCISSPCEYMSRVYFNHHQYVHATLDYNSRHLFNLKAIFKAQKVLSILIVKFYSIIPKKRNRFIVLLLDVTRFEYNYYKEEDKRVGEKELKQVPLNLDVDYVL